MCYFLGGLYLFRKLAWLLPAGVAEAGVNHTRSLEAGVASAIKYAVLEFMSLFPVSLIACSKCHLLSLTHHT